MYKDVYVLLILWKDAVTNFSGLVSKLQVVFEDKYKFKTVTLPITLDENPNKLVRKNLNSFLDSHDSKENLLIIFYGGHGEVNDGHLFWKCNDGDSDPDKTVRWHDHQSLLLSGRDSDCLLLLDCCHSSSTISGLWTEKDRLVEAIVACSAEGVTPLRGPKSFTNKLIDILGSDKYFTKPFDTSWLYNGLLSLQNRQGSVADLTGKFTKNFSPLPVTLVSPREKTRSIVIHRPNTDDKAEEKRGGDKAEEKGRGDLKDTSRNTNREVAKALERVIIRTVTIRERVTSRTVIAEQQTAADRSPSQRGRLQAFNGAFDSAQRRRQVTRLSLGSADAPP